MKTKYDKRLKKVKLQLQNEKFEALLIRSKSNIYYLCGYPCGDAYVLVTPKESYLFVDFIYEEEAHATCSNMNIVRVDKSLALSLSAVLKKAGISSVGFEANQMFFSAVEIIKKQTTGCRFYPRTRLVEKIRMIKDREEIAAITESVKMLEQGLEFLRDMKKLGLSEQQIAREYEYHLYKLGAECLSFDTIMASGPNSSRPHAVIGPSVTAPKTPLLVDSGIKHKNYCSDLTRTFILNNINQDFSRVYDIVLQAQQKAIKAARPGMKMSELDAVARDHISSHGYGDNFGHSLGHGVGLEVHEEPRVTCSNHDKLEPGMVITLEPGIYLPGKFGVRIEDMAVITKNGCDIISSFDKTLDSAITS